MSLELELFVCVNSKAHSVFKSIYAAVFEFFAVFPVFCTADFPSISDTRCSICFSTLSRIVFSIFCKQQKTQKFSYFTKTVEPYAALRISVSGLLTQNAAQGIASMFRAAWIFIFWHILIRCTGHFFADLKKNYYETIATAKVCILKKAMCVLKISAPSQYDSSEA